MNVSGHIFFENIFKEHIDTPCEFIKTSQKRLRLRQCIHEGHDVLEALEEYKGLLDNVIDYVEHHSQQTLAYQPYFTWTVNGAAHKSTCWYYESLMVKTCMAKHLELEALAHIKEGEFKKANKCLTKARDQHQSVFDHELALWSWKEPGSHFACILPQWHMSRTHILNARKDLCMYQKALGDASIEPKTMLKLSKRMEDSAVNGLAHWLTTDQVPECKVARAMTVIQQAEGLHLKEKRGTAIALAEEWMPVMQSLQSEWAPLCISRIANFKDTLTKWSADNNSIYFDAVDEDLLTSTRSSIEGCESLPSHRTGSQ